MQIRITPKTKGNMVNVRQAMSGKGNKVIVTRYADGDVVDAELARNGNWFKTEDGYVRADLVTVIETKIAVEESDEEFEDGDDFDFEEDKE